MEAESVVIKFNDLSGVTGKARKGLRSGLMLVGFAIQQRWKIHIVEQNAVDTGALLNGVYVEASWSKGGDGASDFIGPLTPSAQSGVSATSRDAALIAAKEAASLPGAHSGKPHAANPGVPSDLTAAISVKVAEVMEYGIFIELGDGGSGGRPCAKPAAEEVSPMVAEMVAKAMGLELGK